MKTIAAIALATAAALSAVPAQAQTQDGIQAGDWLVRLRGIVVSPTESSGPVTPSFPTGSVGVSDSVMPEIDFTYMATPNIGAELILATTKHNIAGRGALAPLGDVGSTWALPPTLTLQYHFMPEAKVRPYIGAGVNYTIFHSSDASDSLEAAVGKTSLKLDDSFGYALQAGIDIDITKSVFLNLDIKYIDMNTTARLKTGAVTNTVDVDLDPLVFGAGVGMRF